LIASKFERKMLQHNQRPNDVVYSIHVKRMLYSGSNHLAFRGGNFYSKLCSQILHTDEIKKEDAQINNLTL
jgi:hypothetical protein